MFRLSEIFFRMCFSFRVATLNGVGIIVLMAYIGFVCLFIYLFYAQPARVFFGIYIELCF